MDTERLSGIHLENQEKNLIYEFGRELSNEAGTVLLKFSKQRNDPIWKSNTDFKTQADDAVAKLVRERIAEKFPTHSIWSEELQPKEEGDNWWYIDELDGTLLFARSYSNRWSFSLGFQSEDLKFGFINQPELNKLYEAVEGEQALCNEEPIAVSECSDINKAIVAWDAGKGQDRDAILPYVKKLFGREGATYAPANGCASGALVSVANGELDAYVATSLQPEDMAGAVPIILGAGGIVTAIDGKEWHPHSRSILAANTILHKELLKFFQSESQL